MKLIEKLNNKSGEKKTKYILLVLLIIIIIGVLYFNRGLTDKEKDERISRAYITEGYDAARELIYDYYGTSDTAYSWIKVLYTKEEEKVKDKLIIENQNLKTRSKKYYDYDVTIYNGSDETLSYIEVTIYLKDYDEKIISTDWTNWSGTLPSGASVTLDTMIDKPKDTVYYYSVVIDEVSIK